MYPVGLNKSARAEVLLSLQRALLGHVTAQMRAVGVAYDDAAIRVTVFTDELAGQDVTEAVQGIETELMADFPEHEVVVAPAVGSQPLPRELEWAFIRAGVAVSSG